jgi:hypothetical protein
MSVSSTMPGVTEADWQRQVIDLLAVFGWQRWVHFRPAQTARGWRTAFTGHGGFPDIVAVKPVSRWAGEGSDFSMPGGVPWRMVALELKAGRNKPTIEQVDWIASLDAIPGVDARILYPDQLDELVELLR